jgi:hypothetical protein
MKRKSPNVEAYFSQSHKIRARRDIATRFLKVGGVAFAAALTAFLFLRDSPIFVVQSVTVKNPDGVPIDASARDLALMSLYASWKGTVFGHDNILSWPLVMTPEAMRFFPGIKDATIEKNFIRRSVTVRVAERRPFAIWCLESSAVSNRCWWWDKEGVIFEKAPKARGNLIPVVHDSSQEEKKLGDRVLDDEAMLANMMTVFDVLSVAEIPVKDIHLSDIALRDVRVDTYNGPTMLFNLRFPASNAAEVIASLRKEPGLSRLSSVDFRVENRVYYKEW